MQKLTSVSLVVLALLSPCFAFAMTSTIEFKIPFDGENGEYGFYQIILDEEEPRNDLIRRKSANGEWIEVYLGEVTSVDLPNGSRLEQLQPRGPRGRQPGLVAIGGYDNTKPRAAGLRFRTVSRLGVVTEFGTVILPWPGKVMEVSELDSEMDPDTGLSVAIVSVRGMNVRSTYLIMNDDYSNPYLVSPNYYAEPLDLHLEDGKIYLPKLNQILDPQELRARRRILDVPAEVLIKNARDSKALLALPPPPNLYRKHKVAPGAQDVMDELIHQLDEREPMASASNAEAQVRRAVRGLLFREFPDVADYAMGEPKIEAATIKVVNGVAALWLMGRIHDANTIRRILVGRLEAAVPNRSKACELSLLPTSGSGGHAAAYYRGEVMRGLNTIFRRLYK